MKVVLALVAAAPLFAQCTVTVSPATVNIGAGTSASPSVTGTVISVGAPAGCAWTATTNTLWIHLGAVLSGNGDGNFFWSADRNTLPISRTGGILIGGQPATVTQAAAVCTYAFKPPTPAGNVPAGGGSGTAQLQTGCSWTARPNQNWITLSGGTSANPSGTSDAPINYTVAPNGCVNSRSGSITAGLPGTNSSFYQATFPVNQDGAPENLTVSPASLTLGAGAVDGKIAIATGTGCAWSAKSDLSWFQLVAPVSGSGNGNLSYHVVPNTSSARSGTVRIGSQTITVTQQAPPTPIPIVSAVTNAASGVQGPVSPGEIISIYGTNLGPTPGVPLQLNADGQSIAKVLGNVQVLFDGVPAALTFAGAVQINAVVPYAVAGKSSTQMQVSYQAESSKVPLDVQAASPGIFTQDNSGIGLGAILNQDFTLNAPANRAAAGDIVQIFCTGGGVTDPPSVDAALSGTPFPQLTLPVAVTIGGLDAPVVYSGAAPFLIAGLTQINARVPAGVVPGPGVSLTVQVGSAKSQAGVTVAIR